MTDPAARARELDAQDALAAYRSEFLPMDPVAAYLDGNSLGRPLKASADALDTLVRQQWATRLIQGWTDEWMDWPEQTGDTVARVCLGAAAGQTIVADSTTVMLYKLARAAVAARPDRHKIVLDRDNFPTDRYVLEGISRECGLELVWIETDPDEGAHPEQVAAVLDDDVALVVLSHVAYRSAWLADAQAITRLAHDHGALMLWDLCHSVGAVPMQLDDWDVDFAVGCTYKYLNGGPGAPAFGYVNQRLLGEAYQPIQGWMGRHDPFLMEQGYVAAQGIRSFVSGTPPIVGMVPLRASLEVIERAGVEAIRAKSVALTQFVIETVDSWGEPAGGPVRIASPRNADRRGGHVTLCRNDFRAVNDRLWRESVIPDFREPDGIRIGLSPLSTSFAEVAHSLDVLRGQLG